MIPFERYRYMAFNSYSETHYTNIDYCIWCNAYIPTSSRSYKIKKQTERKGQQIDVKYNLPYCSPKCYHDDPNGLIIMAQFIKDSEDWRKKYLLEEEREKKYREEQAQKNKEENKKIKIWETIIGFLIFVVLIILGYLI